MGGAEKVLFDLAASLKKAGFYQTIIYFHDGPFVAMFAQADIKIIKIAAPGGPLNPVWWWRLVKAIQQARPDLIHTWLWLANLAGRLSAQLLRIPVVCALHNNHDQNGLLRNTIDAATLWAADELVAVSDGIVRTMAHYRFFPAWRVRVIANGIPLLQKRVLPAAEVRRLNDLRSGTFIFGSVGRFVPLKRYDLLIKVFAGVHQDIPRTHLLLIGAGPQEQLLQKQIDDLGMRRAVTLIVGQPALGYYPFFDCFIQPSRKEGISIALLEAMAAHIPCIVTNQEPIHDVILDGHNGFLLPADDPVLLAQTMNMLIGDAEKRRMVGKEAARTIARRFTLARMVDEYQRLYRSMMGQ
jgi:glycosyltransferase involved in cell wall biosynthesis